jgi:hypothetical protein
MDWVESLDSPKPYMGKKQPPEKSYGAEQALWVIFNPYGL